MDLKAGNTLNLRPVDTDGGVCATFGLPEVHNELFDLLGVESQFVVGAPLRQVLDLFPVGQLMLPLMRPITVVSSANFTMVLEPCTAVQSWVKREKPHLTVITIADKYIQYQHCSCTAGKD